LLIEFISCSPIAPFAFISPLHFPFLFLVFEIQAFRHESQHFAPTIFQAKKITLMMPPRRLSQRLLRLGDEATLAPSTQVLPDITEGQEIEAFAKIEEIELQHATNVVGTSAGAAGSGQNAGGVSHHSP
jgi:hypothetical protein